MLCKQHYEKMIAKLVRFEETLNPYLFTKIQSLPTTAFVANKQFHTIPTNEKFKEISSGWKWGGEGAYCWLKTEYVVPEELDGKDIFIMPKMGGYEASITKYAITNMLEEGIESIVDNNVLNTQFRPFEIKTIKAYY